MKKMMLAVMAAMVICSTGTALAATPDRGFCGDNAPAVETSCAYYGGGHHGHGHGGYGCGDYERGHRGGYCWGNENQEG